MFMRGIQLTHNIAKKLGPAREDAVIAEALRILEGEEHEYDRLSEMTVWEIQLAQELVKELTDGADGAGVPAEVK